ncbi:MAG TPA: UbiX family flavin prenyltransferase [Bryobacteraceae bacterium]
MLPSLMRLIVGITGASGAIFGIRALEALRELGVETHLVLSRWARTTIAHETAYSLEDVEKLASAVHREDNQAAVISSGSFQTNGMIVAPCSMRTLAAIRAGYGDTLVCRAADVVLKERRKLVLLARENPLHEIHLENMLALARMGVVIFPPVPAFYDRPKRVQDIVDHIVGRALDQFGLEMPTLSRWRGFSVPE